MASSKIETRRVTKLTLRRPATPVYAVELEGEPWEEIDAEVAAHFGLTTGLALDAEQSAAILAASRERQTRRRLHRYLSGRLRARRQIDQYLRRQRFGEERLDDDTRARLLAWAESQGLVDDARFAGAFVRTHKRTRLVGPRRLRSELVREGVARDIADRIVEEHRGRDFQQTITPDEGEAVDDADLQREECVRLLHKRAERWRREADPRKRWQKAQRFLLGRGYEGGPVAAAMRAYWAEARQEEIED